MWLVVSWATLSHHSGKVGTWTPQRQTSICSSPSPREWQFFFLKNNFIFGCSGSSLLHRLFSSCGKRGLLSNGYAWVSYFGGFSCCGHGIYSMQTSAVVVPGLLSTGSVVEVQGHVGSCLIRDHIHVSCVSRHILYHWATREALRMTILKKLYW